MGWGVHPPARGTVYVVGRNALGFSFELLEFPQNAEVPVEAVEVQMVPVTCDNVSMCDEINSPLLG